MTLTNESNYVIMKIFFIFLIANILGDRTIHPGDGQQEKTSKNSRYLALEVSLKINLKLIL